MGSYGKYNENGNLLDETGKTLLEALNIGYNPNESDETQDKNNGWTYLFF